VCKKEATRIWKKRFNFFRYFQKIIYGTTVFDSPMLLSRELADHANRAFRSKLRGGFEIGSNAT